jgi:hypothetical protein
LILMGGVILLWRAYAPIDHKSGARKISLAGGMQLGENRHQLDGKIVDTIKAHVFEGF